jgi:hypothetical protein
LNFRISEQRHAVFIEFTWHHKRDRPSASLPSLLNGNRHRDLCSNAASLDALYLRSQDVVTADVAEQSSKTDVYSLVSIVLSHHRSFDDELRNVLPEFNAVDSCDD